MNNFGLLLVAVIAAVVLWYVLRGVRHPIATTRPIETMRSALADDDERILFHSAVSGESHYQENIRRAAAVGKVVSLIPEPKNPHDKNAVRVDVDGLTIGYIPRDNAERARDDEWKAIISAVNPGRNATGIVLGITETYRDKPRTPISEKRKPREPRKPRKPRVPAAEPRDA